MRSRVGSMRRGGRRPAAHSVLQARERFRTSAFPTQTRPFDSLTTNAYGELLRSAKGMCSALDAR